MNHIRLQWALTYGLDHVAHQCLAEGANPNQPFKIDGAEISPLVLATFSNYPKLVTALIEAGANLYSDYKVMPAMNEAIEHRYWPIVRLLVEKGADPNYTYRGKTLLQHAHEDKEDEVVLDLVVSGANPLKKGFYESLGQSRLARRIKREFIRTFNQPSLTSVINAAYQGKPGSVNNAIKSIDPAIKTRIEELTPKLEKRLPESWKSKAEDFSTYLVFSNILDQTEDSYHRASEDVLGILPEGSAIETGCHGPTILLKGEQLPYVTARKSFVQSIPIKLPHSTVDSRNASSKSTFFEKEIVNLKLLQQRGVLNRPGLGKYLKHFSIPGKGNSLFKKRSIRMLKYPAKDLWSSHDPKTPLSPIEVKVAVTSSLLAVALLHSAQIVHRDLKPDQFLKVVHNEDLYGVDLIDFDSAITATETDVATGYGKSAFLQPLKGSWYQADVWALAKTLLLVATHSKNYKCDPEELLEQVKDPDLSQLLRGMSDPDPKNRLTVFEALTMWLNTQAHDSELQRRLEPMLRAYNSNKLEVDKIVRDWRLRYRPSTAESTSSGPASSSSSGELRS